MNGHSDILIIGGGIAGMTAALYAARANLSVRIVEKEVCGGLVNWTHTVENVPSYKSIHGMDLMTACREHVESLGVAIEEVNEVEEVRLDGQPKEIRTSEGDSFTADVVIIATGRKPIPLPVETAFEKVHYCSVCDGTAYKDKTCSWSAAGTAGSTNPCTSRASASVPSISWKCSRPAPPHSPHKTGLWLPASSGQT